jgi:hypothetical protein
VGQEAYRGWSDGESTIGPSGSPWQKLGTSTARPMDGHHGSGPSPEQTRAACTPLANFICRLAWGRMARGTVSHAGGRGGRGAWGAESGAVRRLSQRAMRGAGRGSSASDADGNAETRSVRLGRITEERGQNRAPCHVDAYTTFLRSSIDLR